MKKLLVIMFATAIVGCSSTSDNEGAVQTSKNKSSLDCKKVKTTGSSIPRKICSKKG